MLSRNIYRVMNMNRRTQKKWRSSRLDELLRMDARRFCDGRGELRGVLSLSSISAW
jgi:hypothetical protein